MIKRSLLVFISLFYLIASFGQNGTVSGTLSDSLGEKIIGAAVVVKGTNMGSISDENGFYKIANIDLSNAILVTSYSGYKTKQIKVNGRSTVNIILLEISNNLNQVMVVGYGTSTKKEFTGANANLIGEELQKLNIPRIDQALQGQISGVNISTNSGSPGGSSSIRIRGLSTFGDNDPLILVDGVVYDSEGLNALNPPMILNL